MYFFYHPVVLFHPKDRSKGKKGNTSGGHTGSVINQTLNHSLTPPFNHSHWEWASASTGAPVSHCRAGLGLLTAFTKVTSGAYCDVSIFSISSSILTPTRAAFASRRLKRGTICCRQIYRPSPHSRVKERISTATHSLHSCRKWHSCTKICVNVWLLAVNYVIHPYLINWNQDWYVR